MAANFTGFEIYRDIYLDEIHRLASTNVGAVHDVFRQVQIDGQGTRVDRVDDLRLSKKQDRLQAPNKIDQDFTARFLSYDTFHADVDMDRDDWIKMARSSGELIQVNAQRLMEAARAEHTRCAMGAFFANAKQGQNAQGTTDVAFDTASNQIAAAYAAGAFGQAETGLSMDKLDRTLQIFSERGIVPNEANPVYVVVFEEVWQQFKATNVGTLTDVFPVINSDFGGQPLSRLFGPMFRYREFVFIKIPKSYFETTAVPTEYRLPVFMRDGMAFGMPSEVPAFDVNIFEPKETVIETITTRMLTKCGATRVDDDKVLDLVAVAS